MNLEGVHKKKERLVIKYWKITLRTEWLELPPRQILRGPTDYSCTPGGLHPLKLRTGTRFLVIYNYIQYIKINKHWQGSRFFEFRSMARLPIFF